MSTSRQDQTSLMAENAALRAKLDEAEETMRAIRSGEVDALLVDGRVYTLESAEAASNRFRGEVLARVDEAVIAIDLERHITFLNPAAERLYGVAASAVLGRAVDTVFRQLSLPAQDQAVAAALREHGTWRGESIHFTASGRTIPVETTVSLLRDDAGAETGKLAFVRDIAVRKRDEEAIRQTEERFRVMAETLPDIIFTANPDGAHDYHNPRFYQITGLPPGTGMGFGWLAALHPDDAGRVRQGWADAMASGEPHRIEFRYRTADEGYRWFSQRARPIRNAKTNITKWFGSCSDIDEHMRAAEILEQTVAERTAKLKETISELEAFSYSISHDLRAPLRAMQSYASFLRSEYESKLGLEGREYVRRIVAATDRMDRLIQDVLVYSRVARSELKLERIELGSFLHGLIEVYPQFADANAVIEIVAPLAAVQANQAALTQCVSNLMGNAIKFVAKGVKPRVRLWTETRHDRVRLYVRDNGIGIKKSEQSQIFEIFHQLESGRGGTGIGLAVVRKAAERMGGSVSVESDAGAGSTFCLELLRGID